MNIIFHIILLISLLSKREDINTTIENVYLLPLGNKQVPVQIIQYGDRRDVVMLNLHDNERTSVNAAKKVLAETGGVLLRIENDSLRMISFSLPGGNESYTFDPNRMFTIPGIEASLAANSKNDRLAVNAVKIFSDSLLSLLPATAETIIALHNNDETPGLSIESYAPTGKYRKEAAEVFVNYAMDPDNFYLATTRPLFLKAVNHQRNAILQDNINLTDDGSLSVFMGLRNRPYINVEAEHGHEEEQTRMISILMK